MAGKWPPPPDFEVDSKFSVTETTYGAMNQSVALLLERRRAQNKAFREPVIRRIPPPLPPNLCIRDPPDVNELQRFEPPPTHKSIDCTRRYDRYLHDMERYEKFQEHNPKTIKTEPASKTTNARIGRWGANWRNVTEAWNATGGYDLYINGNARYKAQEKERQRMAAECFARRLMPSYATNRTSRQAIVRTGRDPFDTYCTMLTPPNRTYTLDFRNVDCSYPTQPPPDYKYKGFYQYRPFRSSVGIADYNKAMEGYFTLSRHPSRVPQPVTTV